MVEQFRKYIDDPQSLLRDWRLAQTRAMREAVVGQLAEDAPGWPVEQILHDDVSEPEHRPVDRAGQTRRLLFGRAALHVAARIESRLLARQFLLALIALVATLLLGSLALIASKGGLVFTWGSSAAGFSLAMIGGYLLYLASGVARRGYEIFLPRGPMLTDPDKADLRRLAERVLLRVAPDDVPADLADQYRPLTVDADGQPVDGQIVGDDYTTSWLREALSSMLAVVAAVGLSVFAIGLAMTGVPLFSLLTLPLLVLAVIWTGMKVFLLPDLAKRRGLDALEALRRSPTAKLVDQVSPVVFQKFEAAKVGQITQATADQTPFVDLGRTTGLLSGRRDPFAPTQAGMPCGLSVDDLSTHLLALGATGAGKTAGVLRPVIGSWTDADAGGLLVLDGKGVLPEELADLDGFQVITPGLQVFAPIENLTPDQVADSLYEMFAGQSESKDPFWEKAAAELIRSAAKTLALLVDLEVESWDWTLGHLHHLIFGEGMIDAAKAVVESAPESKVLSLMPGHVRRAYDDFTRTFPAMPADTANSIKQNASVWLGLLVNNAQLSAWADAATGVQIEQALHGERIGLLLPEFKFGKAGAVITNFAKQRFYSEIKRRGEGWKSELDGHRRVMLVVDECQALMTESEAEILPIARSLGLCAVFATQNIDGLQIALKNQPALLQQILGQFRSIIAVAVNTDATCEFVAGRMGAVPRAIYSEVPAPASDAAGTIAGLQLEAGSFGVGTVMASASWSSELRGMRGTGGLAGEAWAMASQLAEKSGVKKAFELLPGAFNREARAGSAKLDTHPLVSPAEVRGLTAERFTALAVVNRAGVERRDLIKLSPRFGFAQQEVA